MYGVVVSFVASSWIEPLGVGKKVVFNQLVEIAMSVEGVYDVLLSSPTGDVEIDTDQLPVLDSLVVRFEGAVS